MAEPHVLTGLDCQARMVTVEAPHFPRGMPKALTIAKATGQSVRGNLAYQERRGKVGKLVRDEGVRWMLNH